MVRIITNEDNTMTQEELDALMNVDIASQIGDDAPIGDHAAGAAGMAGATGMASVAGMDPNNFRMDQDMEWPPPPPSKEHKVVHQLDDVAREGEEKSSQIFDILEKICSDASDSEAAINAIVTNLSGTRDVFERLHDHFPQIKTFETQLEKLGEVVKSCDRVRRAAQNTNDQMMVAMDVMQYQDIHRQKIERVINVMRALSRYMNSLFDTKIADEKRVSSAVHIVGDVTEDVVNDEDIEALIAAFGDKK
ncbi:chemotaxis protein [Campylobacterota bacterium]|nr:chemotaxis protein [Campylobacterota bacterium]